VDQRVIFAIHACEGKLLQCMMCRKNCEMVYTISWWTSTVRVERKPSRRVDAVRGAVTTTYSKNREIIHKINFEVKCREYWYGTGLPRPGRRRSRWKYVPVSKPSHNLSRSFETFMNQNTYKIPSTLFYIQMV
jgi:hypothetical protein